jgi:NAD(P)-dependent dehydrogenase (short-subunit alcohol dehydrogenase family)
MGPDADCQREVSRSADQRDGSWHARARAGRSCQYDLGVRNSGAGPVMADTTAKADRMNLTRSLAKDLAPYIRVNAVAPGHHDTDMTRAAGEGFIASVVPATP